MIKSQAQLFVAVLDFMVTAVVSDVPLCLIVCIHLCPTQAYGVLYNLIPDDSLQQVALLLC